MDKQNTFTVEFETLPVAKILRSKQDILNIQLPKNLFYKENKTGWMSFALNITQGLNLH